MTILNVFAADNNFQQGGYLGTSGSPICAGLLSAQSRVHGCARSGRFDREPGKARLSHRTLEGKFQRVGGGVLTDSRSFFVYNGNPRHSAHLHCGDGGARPEHAMFWLEANRASLSSHWPSSCSPLLLPPLRITTDTHWRVFEEGKAAPLCDVSRHSWLVGASKEGRERLSCTF